MTDESIFDLIKHQVTSGMSAAKIQEGLLAKGYAAEDINGAFARLQLHSSTQVLEAALEPLAFTPPKKSMLPSTIAFSFLICGVIAVGYVMYADLNDSPKLKALREVILADKAYLAEKLTGFQLKKPPPPLSTDTQPSTASSTSTDPIASTTAQTTEAVPKKEPPPPPVVVVPPPAPVIARPAPGSIPTVTLSASATHVSPGTAVTLTWVSQNALSCQGVGFRSDGLTNGSVSVIVNGSYQFKMTCTNDYHAASRSVEVTSQR